MDPFRFTPGTRPLLVSMPHVGTHLPDDLAVRMTDSGRALADTDWHVDLLYDFLGKMGAGVIAATHSRYVIDLNRAPDDRALYPGASNTELCPTTTFDSEAIYQEGREPNEREVTACRERIWQPYHEKLESELARLKEEFGCAILWEAHSIRSHVPRFFDGRLPDLNLGTAGGGSAAPALVRILEELLRSQDRYSYVVDGRFKGGYITRAYGRPDESVHALQMELSQITYMDESPPYTFRKDLAEGIRPLLRDLLQRTSEWADQFYPS